MSITYEHKYDVKNIYNAFKKNRVNAVSYLGTSNNRKLEPDSSAYLSYENLYVNNYTYTYIYARKSSPTIDSDTDKNYAYLKVGDTTYNFYHGHAYTYTETVTGNGLKPILIAYDFVNQISTHLEFKDVSISHNASPISDIPQTVNVFSPISYIIENGEKSLDPKNEYSISSSNINTLLDGSTFADFTTYVTYSYLNPEKGDGIVYDDGKDTLSTNSINDIHIWSLSDGVDMRPHAYVDNDTTAVNAYTYLNCGNILNTFFRNNVSNIFDYNSINYKYIKFYYDISVSNTNGVLQQWKAGIVGTDKIYAKDVRTGDNILDYSTFYQVCKVDLPDVSSFNEIYNKPSLRDNSDEINCYININGNSFPGDQEISYINKSNTNKSRFVKKINNLPVHILSNTIDFTINLNLGGQPGIGANDSPTNGHIQDFKLILLENEQNPYGYKEYSIPLKIELYPYNRYGNVRSMKVISVTKPESIDDNEYEINNWQQSPSNINDDVEQYKFKFELKILDDKLKDIFSRYEDENLLLKILDLQFEASGSCTGRDDGDAKIIFSAVGKNCLSEKTNSEYEYNTFRITRSTSNGYLSSINIDITYGDSLNN